MGLNMDSTLTLEKSGAQIINHNHASLLTIQSNGNTKIESVEFNAGAVTSMTTLNMDGTLTLETSGAQIINHNHDSLLTIQSTGNTKIEAVTFNEGAISTVTTLGMSGTLSLTSTSAQAITHTGSGSADLTVSSTNGNTKIEAVTFNTGAISTVTTLGMSGTLSLTSSNAQAITHLGSGSADPTVSSTNGKVKIEAVTFNIGAISTVTTLGMSSTLSLTSALAQAITHLGTNSGSKDLTVSSTNGKVKIEAVTFNAGAISTVTTLNMDGALSGVTTLNMDGTLT